MRTYYAWSVILAVGCLAQAYAATTDLGLFGSGYFRAKRRRALAGAVLCLVGLAVVVVAATLVRVVKTWHGSELDHIAAWERARRVRERERAHR